MHECTDDQISKSSGFTLGFVICLLQSQLQEVQHLYVTLLLLLARFNHLRVLLLFLPAVGVGAVQLQRRLPQQTQLQF
jgi:hypothetical protein